MGVALHYPVNTPADYIPWHDENPLSELYVGVPVSKLQCLSFRIYGPDAEEWINEARLAQHGFRVLSYNWTPIGWNRFGEGTCRLIAVADHSTWVIPADLVADPYESYRNELLEFINYRRELQRQCAESSPTNSAAATSGRSIC